MSQTRAKIRKKKQGMNKGSWFYRRAICAFSVLLYPGRYTFLFAFFSSSLPYSFLVFHHRYLYMAPLFFCLFFFLILFLWVRRECRITVWNIKLSRVYLILWDIKKLHLLLKLEFDLAQNILKFRVFHGERRWREIKKIAERSCKVDILLKKMWH